jgi:hypothetical protein
MMSGLMSACLIRLLADEIPENAPQHRRALQPQPTSATLALASERRRTRGEGGRSLRRAKGLHSLRRTAVRQGQDAQTSVGTHAGTYVFGSKGSNACSEGSTRIVNWTVCSIAAEDSGRIFYGNQSTTSLPEGCIVRYDYQTCPLQHGLSRSRERRHAAAVHPRCAALALRGNSITPSGHTLGDSNGTMRATKAVLKAHSRKHLTQTLLQSAQSRSDECAACM